MCIEKKSAGKELVERSESGEEKTAERELLSPFLSRPAALGKKMKGERERKSSLTQT